MAVQWEWALVWVGGLERTVSLLGGVVASRGLWETDWIESERAEGISMGRRPGMQDISVERAVRWLLPCHAAAVWLPEDSTFWVCSWAHHHQMSSYLHCWPSGSCQRALHHARSLQCPQLRKLNIMPTLKEKYTAILSTVAELTLKCEFGAEWR